MLQLCGCCQHISLAAWVDKFGIYPTYPTTERGAVSVIVDNNNAAIVELFHLSDYAVSSRCGVVVWLVPRLPQADDEDSGAKYRREASHPSGIRIAGYNQPRQRKCFQCGNNCG